MSVRRRGVERVLFITLSNIGDIVLSTPVLGVLRGEFPKAKIDVMSGPNGEEIFRSHPMVHDWFLYDKRAGAASKAGLIKSLRRKKYDCIVDLRNSLFPFLVGARLRTSPLVKPPRSVRHKKKAHLYKLRSVGINVKDAPFAFHVGKEDEGHVRELLDKNGPHKDFIVISPGAKSHIKRWTAAGFAGLCDMIEGELGLDIVMVGGENDRAIVETIQKGARCKFINLAGRLSLRQLGALLKRSQLLVTNDSAPMHIAWALGVRTVAIFGPTDPQKYGPYGTGNIIVRKKIKCSPCETAQCRFKHECMGRIEAGEVIRAIRSAY
ncbi:MAG: glycosyltransferase family 9 protein [Candidatus Omnitrophota bacterium]